MNSQQQEVLKLLKELNENGLHTYIILIGSWAEYMYSATGLLPDYDAQIRTLDIDFLVPNKRRPTKPQNLSALAKELGYSYQEDIITGATKLIGTNELEIEFLIGKRGAGTEAAVKTNLGVTAQALNHMAVLRDNTIEVSYLGVNVIVPKPEAFFLHKIVINEERGAKAEKDRQVINSIFFHLNREEIERIREKLTKKENKRVDRYYADYIIPILEREEMLKRAKEMVDQNK